MPISIDDIDSYVQYGIRICINYASQIGASVVLLACLALLTKAEKRSSAIFILNVFALVFNIIRNVLQCVYFTGPFYEAYTYFSYDYSDIPLTAIAASATGVVFSTLMLICIEASLVLQVRAVCVTMTRTYRLALLLLSFLVAATAVGFRLGLTVQNCRAIADVEGFYNYQWLAAASLYLITASICFFSAIFVGKLAVALRQRHRLGLRQFGPMQIIFIMGCQTLIIPAIFSTLQWASSAPELGSQVLTVVAIFLPLSSMWASHSLGGGPSPSVINSKGRSGFLGFFSGRSRNTQRSDRSASFLKPNEGKTSATNESLTPPHLSISKADDDVESGGLKIYRSQVVDVSQETR